ncbi:MAG: hypothetical protein LBV27_02180 [Oscillospiraceae bacterium]|jgi:hypothetical protein|nr:hypothetical protein [Oscillospiraceae bacterium]
MKAMELTNWHIKACDADIVASSGDLLAAARAGKDQAYASEKAAQVHDILIESGAIAPTFREDGRADYCAWVAETDWAYTCRFETPTVSDGQRVFLHAPGLDTVCTLFLNGNAIAASKSMYLPVRVDVTTLLQNENELLIYFHRHTKVLAHYAEILPDEWKGNVSPGALYRKAGDYGHRPQDHHGISPIGLFDNVCLETVDQAGIAHADIAVDVAIGLGEADVTVALDGHAYADAALSAEITVCEEGGANPVHEVVAVRAEGDQWHTTARLHIQSPKLWWPKNYGSQPMYKAEIRLLAGGKAVDTVEKPFGIRKIRHTGNFVFEVNDVPVRFWGGNFAPIWGPSNTFNAGAAFDLIDKIDLAGMNAIRIWGPSKPYPNEFYDQFDRRGILVWQDFPTGGGQLPCSDEYKALFRAEAENMVHKLMHHPSIYMWCGGNENIYMAEQYGQVKTFGFDILTQVFRDVCAAIDPERYYHADCPYGGRYTNDPAFGDSHGSRALRAYCAGEDYCACYSENIRVYPPQYKSFMRWNAASVWEEGYIDAKYFGTVKPVPAPWQKLVGNNGEEKFGPIWDYYAADNPRDLIYKFTDAAGQDLYRMYARSRHGNPTYKSHERAFCRGFMVWKLNDPWPNFYCALVDYYGECSAPYYYVKRAIRPVMVDFEVGDHIYMWGVNDTRENCVGTVELTFYNVEFEEVRRTVSLPVALEAGKTRIITDLDDYGFLHWFTLLHLRLLDSDGNQILTSNAYLTKENMYPFHDATLSLEMDGDAVIVRTDKFARSVELMAGDDGNAFGWVFEDNYFDLFPFETKRVKIQRRGAGGCILAKGQYSSNTAKVIL